MDSLKDDFVWRICHITCSIGSSLRGDSYLATAQEFIPNCERGTDGKCCVGTGFHIRTSSLIQDEKSYVG